MPIPKGLRPPAQGWRGAPTLGHRRRAHQPQRGCGKIAVILIVTLAITPLAVGVDGIGCPMTQGSRIAATLGFGTESRWDSWRLRRAVERKSFTYARCPGNVANDSDPRTLNRHMIQEHGDELSQVRAKHVQAKLAGPRWNGEKIILGRGLQSVAFGPSRNNSTIQGERLSGRIPRSQFNVFSPGQFRLPSD